MIKKIEPIKTKSLEIDGEYYDKIESRGNLQYIADQGGWDDINDLLSEIGLKEEDVMGKWLSYSGGAFGHGYVQLLEMEKKS